MDDKSFNVRVPKRWARIAMIVGTTALIVAPLTAIASHSFTDVPNSNTFHEDIAWLADADVTRGCNPPDNTEFCPDDDVTRGQMAAFMRRFSQYLGAEDGTPAQADNATTADNATNADNADMLDGLDSSDFVEASSQIEGTFTCAGTAHTPYDAEADYDSLGSLRFHELGTNLYRCNAHLPHGAVVNSVSYAVRDASTGTMDCEMWRTNTVTSIGTETEMVDVQSTGTPGDTVITDDTVEVPTIDNENHAYFTQCRFLSGTDANTGLWGVTIDYTHNPNATVSVTAESADPSGEGSGE